MPRSDSRYTTTEDLSAVLRAGPKPIFDRDVVQFLDALSRRLLGSPEARLFPDLITFAFWCRSASMVAEAKRYVPGPFRQGRGLAFHVTPANIPMNFAYSYAASLVAGNTNIVRLPSVEFPQVGCFEDAYYDLKCQAGFSEVAGRSAFLRIPRGESHRFSELSLMADVRLLWGGDDAVRFLRSLETRASCCDLVFPDRYSAALLGSLAILNASEAELATLADGFANDALLFSQLACSSPRLVFWLGIPAETIAAQKRFWPVVQKVAERRFPMSPTDAVSKLNSIYSEAGRGLVGKFTRHGSSIYRVSEIAPQVQFSELQLSHGTFFEVFLNDLNDLKDEVAPRLQTMTYYGVASTQVLELLQTSSLRGIDRVVPVGQGLSMGLRWDGFDLPIVLSRVVDIR